MIGEKSRAMVFLEFHKLVVLFDPFFFKKIKHRSSRDFFYQVKSRAWSVLYTANQDFKAKELYSWPVPNVLILNGGVLNDNGSIRKVATHRSELSHQAWTTEISKRTLSPLTESFSLRLQIRFIQNGAIGWQIGTWYRLLWQTLREKHLVQRWGTIWCDKLGLCVPHWR